MIAGVRRSGALRFFGLPDTDYSAGIVAASGGRTRPGKFSPINDTTAETNAHSASA